MFLDEVIDVIVKVIKDGKKVVRVYIGDFVIYGVYRE